MAFYKTILTRQIFYDIVKKGFFTMLCFIFIIVMIISIILVTQSSRQLIIQHEQLLKETDRLDTEWQNQLLEESVLTEHTSIEAQATTKLNMIRPTLSDEVIIKQSALK